MLEFVMQDEW